MKMFNSTTPKDNILFVIAIILTNFLQGCWINFTFEIISKQMLKFANHGWDIDL
jgi:hypothetical protein